MNKSIIAVVIAVILVVVVAKMIERRNPHSQTAGQRVENAMNRAADNVQEGMDDAGRKLEDAVD